MVTFLCVLCGKCVRLTRGEKSLVIFVYFFPKLTVEQALRKVLETNLKGKKGRKKEKQHEKQFCFQTVEE
jgi:hypothetical protein